MKNSVLQKKLVRSGEGGNISYIIGYLLEELLLSSFSPLVIVAFNNLKSFSAGEMKLMKRGSSLKQRTFTHGG